jgi:uncharacterized membrane protein YjgN (DUF898 family)
MTNSSTVTPLDVPPMDMAQDHPPQLERFSFTGSGSEYFRIWIVNLLLTIMTLGIYSAWAKVRRTRYFYDSTRLADSSFDYHGNALAILKGRVVAVTFIVGYNIAFKASPAFGFSMMGLFALISPWLVWKSLQFKLYNSSYRGIRFGFRGTVGQAYGVYLLLPVLAVLTLYLAAPFAHQRMKRFQHTESRFGGTHFSFQGTVGSFYKMYLIGVLLAMSGVAALCMIFIPMIHAQSEGMKAVTGTFSTTIVFFSLSLYAWLFLLYPIFLTMIQNLIWNKTSLGEHRFQSEMKWSRMAFIAITNIIAVVLTAGLFTPFARIRSMKYRIESMSLVPANSLDNFVAETQAYTSATGEGMADLLDFDLSL